LTSSESLGKHKYDLYLNGLTSLSDAAAESLAKHEGDLYLNGLTSLSDAAAKSLGKIEGYLCLNDSMSERINSIKRELSSKEISEIIGKTFVIKNLEIAQYDFSWSMLWTEAIKSCASLGDTWRLPTIEEWSDIMQPNRYLIGVCEKHELLPNVDPPAKREYWSSTHFSESINYFSFTWGKGFTKNHTSRYFVRAVRTFDEN